jgi:hypothetical protein
MPIAADIDEAIQFAPEDIANDTYNGILSIYLQMGLWIDGLFSAATGIFPPSANGNGNPGQRAITGWYYTSLAARAAIEGPLPNNCGLIGQAAVTNAVSRVLNAVKFAAENDQITFAQRDLVVTLYNDVWPSSGGGGGS